MGPDPATAAVRRAVRAALADVFGTAGPVLAACSGGADSLALAAALAFEAPRHDRRRGLPAGAITIDHGLQEGSAERADHVVRVLRGLGLDPVESAAVTVGREGGPEAAARRARYEALDELAGRLGARVVLLGHTLDDQAETVLLGLARGSGARSLAGMPRSFRRGEIHYVRPLLGLDRATTRRACLAAGLEPWDDPHNEDPAFTRVRVRHEVLPSLERALGPGVVESLARTAAMLRDDADALDLWAGRAYAAALTAVPELEPEPGRVREPVPGPVPEVALEIAELNGLPAAVRTRVLRRAVLEAGGPPGSLAAAHIEAIDRLVVAWRGQEGVDLPGRLRASRRYGKLLLLKTS